MTKEEIVDQLKETRKTLEEIGELQRKVEGLLEEGRKLREETDYLYGEYRDSVGKVNGLSGTIVSRPPGFYWVKVEESRGKGISHWEVGKWGKSGNRWVWRLATYRIPLEAQDGIITGVWEWRLVSPDERRAG